MSHVRIHPPDCPCDQAWAHRPSTVDLDAARHEQRQTQARRRRYGKDRGNAQRLARAQAIPSGPDGIRPEDGAA